jgi:hypothetical protein
MAQVYTDMSKPYGRERYSGPEWMGSDGERAVDIAWKDKANEQGSWGEHEASFPEERRADAKHVYMTAMAVMRKQATPDGP